MLHLILALNASFQAGIHHRNFLYENQFFFNKNIIKKLMLIEFSGSVYIYMNNTFSKMLIISFLNQKLLYVNKRNEIYISEIYK